MKNCSFLGLLASCLLVAALPVRAGEFKWETDLAKAQETAKREQKPVFLLFTGSKWCGVCMALEKKILATERFRKFAAGRMVAVKIDFKEPPFQEDGDQQHAKPLAGADRAKIELAKSYQMNVGQDGKNGLNGYPSVFILSPEGARIGQLETDMGAAENGVEPFLKELEKMIAAPAKP
jgi:thioredoxin-related protein